ncbi:RHS repeat-associated core domain-containing protein [Mediterraneibacter gnavus]|uniref:RHS repeat-associated core domain-containing protein n=1 Tax=Mediterraneibacter gnavus TaxID=33038 RepID=UPI0036D3343A
MQIRYGYDAFGNRTWKEEKGERTFYQYNALNQMVSEKHGEILRAYSYDKRGNLTGIQENGAWKKQYIYGAMNRLEEAVDAAGKQARYQYNGLGHRVGKQEGTIPKEKLEKLDPQSRIGMEIGNSRQIAYTLDLTRQYYNLLERTEENQSQRYFWDGNVAAYEENGERNYYLQDELGSPLRIEDSVGTIKERYGYGAFGEDLYQNQGEIQTFGYTGYQRDEIAGTYYAQAREYLTENGRFAGQDLIAGFMDLPFSMNRYSYCFNTPMILVDLDGAWPSLSDIGKGIKNAIKDVGNAINKGIQKVWNTGKAVGKWIVEHKEDIIKVVGTSLVIAGIAVAAISTSGVAGIVLMGVASGAAIGGAISGAIQGGLSSKLGPVGNIVGGMANGLGTFVTEGLDRIDGYNYKNLGQIGEDSIKSALLGMVCSLPGGLIQAGTLNENILEELMVNYTKRFGDQLNNFFGILDNFLLDITMGGCYNE